MISQVPLVELGRLVESPETGLREILSKLGEVAVVGSYDLGLTHPANPEPDVDVNVLVRRRMELVSLAASVGVALVRNQELPWHKFEVYDNRQARRPTMPPSVYLGTKAYVPGGKVAADIWLYENRAMFDSANQNHMYIKRALTAGAVDTILGIKGEAQNRNTHVSGFALYHAVLEYGVTSLDGYLRLDPEVREALAIHNLNNPPAF